MTLGKCKAVHVPSGLSKSWSDFENPQHIGHLPAGAAVYVR